MERKVSITVLSLVFFASTAWARSGQSAVYDNGQGPTGLEATDQTDPGLYLQAGEGALSQNFAALTLKAAVQIRDWQLHLAYTLQNGYPLSDSWIASDRNRSADAMQLAALAATSNADRAALFELTSLFIRVQSWSDARVDDNRNLRLATYYMSPSALDDDETFQKNIRCTNSLAAMLASGKWEEESICQ